MATALSNEVFDVVRKYLEFGMDISELNLSNTNKERLEMCMNVYKRLEENPNMNIRNYLSREYNRTPNQCVNDIKLIEYIVNVLSHEDRSVTDFRARRHAEQLLDAAHAAGDIKNGVAALKEYRAITHAGEKEDDDDIGKRTMVLQPIMVQITDIDQNKVNYDTEQMRKLRKKYGAATDEIQDMIEVRKDEFEAADEAERIRKTSESIQDRINKAVAQGNFALAQQLLSEMNAEPILKQAQEQDEMDVIASKYFGEDETLEEDE